MTAHQRKHMSGEELAQGPGHPLPPEPPDMLTCHPDTAPEPVTFWQLMKERKKSKLWSSSSAI